MNGKKVKDEEEELVRDMRNAPIKVVNDVKRIARVMAEDYGWKRPRIARAMAVTYNFIQSNKKYHRQANGGKQKRKHCPR